MGTFSSTNILSKTASKIRNKTKIHFCVSTQ